MPYERFVENVKKTVNYILKWKPKIIKQKGQVGCKLETTYSC